MEGLKAMPYPLIYVFAAIGILFLGAMLAFFLAAVCDTIKDRYRKNKAKRIYKNRFNKKPLSNCYCKDCLWFNPLEWDNTIGYCDRTKRNEPDNFFCSASLPKNAERILRENCACIDDK